MAKRYRVRDGVLLGSAVLGDLFFEITKSPYVRMKQFEGILPSDYKITNFTATVNRMLRTEEIEKIIKGGEPYLRLTGRGRRALTRDFPLLKLRAEKWDGKWRMVFYDISEKRKTLRRTLHYKLKSLGFGQLQESVYISPLGISSDMREFIESQGLADRVFVGICKRLLAGDDKQLAANVWRLDKLNERYQEVLDEMDDFSAGRGELSLEQLYHKFEQILLDDPFLPWELLPDWWRGDEVIRRMKELLQRAKK
jgi:phenylacetic acid degradation operon negative regulatory protein